MANKLFRIASQFENLLSKQNDNFVPFVSKLSNKKETGLLDTLFDENEKDDEPKKHSKVAAMRNEEAGSIFDSYDNEDEDEDDEDFSLDEGEEEDYQPGFDDEDDGFGVKIDSLDQLDTGELFDTPNKSIKDLEDESMDEQDLMLGEDGLIEDMDSDFHKIEEDADEDAALEDNDFENAEDDEIII